MKETANNYKKNVILFLTSQMISLFGSSIVQYAIIWYITLSTKSGLMMMISSLCGFVPQIIISFFAGVWADRYDKKKIIILSDIMIAVSSLIIAIVLFLGTDSIWLLFLVMAIRSLGTGIQTPTVNAFMKEITPSDKLMRIGSINSTLQSVMMIASPAVSGALLASFDLSYIILVDVITALIGIPIFINVKYHYEKKEELEKVKYFESIKEGITYAKEHKLIKRLLTYLTGLSFLIAPLALLTPLLVTRTYGIEPWKLTANEITFFVGSVLGGIILSAWGGFKRKTKTIGLSCLICGIFTVFMGVSTNFYLYLFCLTINGITMTMFNTPFVVLLQEKVSEHVIGRIFSIVQIISGAIMPLSMLFFGPLSDIIKIEYILVVTGIMFTLMSIFIMKDKVLKKE